MPLPARNAGLRPRRRDRLGQHPGRGHPALAQLARPSVSECGLPAVGRAGEVDDHVGALDDVGVEVAAYGSHVDSPGPRAGRRTSRVTVCPRRRARRSGGCPGSRTRRRSRSACDHLVRPGEIADRRLFTPYDADPSLVHAVRRRPVACSRSQATGRRLSASTSDGSALSASTSDGSAAQRVRPRTGRPRGAA